MGIGDISRRALKYIREENGMIEWKKKFRESTLERGRAFYLNHKVVDFAETGASYSAAVLGKKRYQVSIRILDDSHMRLSCSCPVARGGKSCEHMAAVLYAAEAREEAAGEQASEPETMEKWQQGVAEQDRSGRTAGAEEPEQENVDVQEQYTLLGGAQAEEQEMAETGINAIAALEKYSYFDGESIRNSVTIPRNAFKEGEELFRQGKVEIERVISGYERSSGEIKGQLDARGTMGRQEFPIRMIFSRVQVTSFECGCPQCRKEYYMWYSGKTKCPYKAVVLKKLEEYLSTHNLGDATDQNAMQLIGSFHRKNSNQVLAGSAAREESLRLVPRLIRKGGDLRVSFKVGEGKLFVVKKLDEFCENVRESATATYGTSTQINHSLNNFTEKGRSWIRFISRIVREEEEFEQRMMNSRNYYSYRTAGVGSDLNLFGWRLDEFYEQLQGDMIEFEDKDGWEKRKFTLSCGKGNPRVTMQISAEDLKGDPEFRRTLEYYEQQSSRGRTSGAGTDSGSGKTFKDSKGKDAEKREEFHGILVEGQMPDMFFGTDTAYYVSDQNLCRIDKEFLEKIEPLADLSNGSGFRFHVGRNHMSEFYHRILPQLKDVVEVTETEPELFRSFLLPDVRFAFYLDAEKQNVTCRPCAFYGEREVSVLDLLDPDRKEELEPFRDQSREEETLFYAMQFLPQIDWQKKELHCGGDEGLVYQVMENGTERLMELGEVRCTKSFLGFHAVKPFKVSVGVSVSAGLLELDIATEDIPPAELLELLASYRAKKKYYRLKDGSFVNLDNSSLEMLSELMDAAHLKPKDFVKGKMHLPMYRTLYLDKMLEENESVYSSRDSHFRKVVKGFKTVKDADFEEPESLSKIMRNYQKDGYKWLRTLETWQFGGILADDMGLGKTLQIIAVLLAAKQEGRKGTSLVVCPASLVFNWGAELERFAPELKVLLVTGTQEERQAIIEDWQKADVMVTSYDLLKRDITFYEEKEFLYEIIDEAQYIKNHTTAAAKAVKVVRSRIRYALTGTPIENRLSELWSIFDYLMPGFLYGYDVFKREMEAPIVKSSDERATKRLQKMVSPFILRRLKEDVLRDLPEKLEEHRYVKFGGAQQKLYDAQVLHMRENLARQNDQEFNKNKMLILAELTRLRQICCDPSLCFDNYKGEAAKLEACLQLIQSAMDGGHRMLVFSQFTSMLEILQRKLDGEGVSYYTITGATSKEKRLQMVKEFNEGSVPVFLISLKAGGVGLNLTGADVVIHYDPWWNLAVQNQATDRAHRIGQTRKVTVYKLIVKNTIEEKIQKLQETKKDLADQIIGGEGAQLGSLSREEILALLEV